MKLVRVVLAVAALALSGAALAGGKVPAINMDGKGVALHGYDAVSYFENDPVPGSYAFSYNYGEATWRFVSAENRKKFARDPQKYLPQFGGYCAKAVSDNDTADIDPLAYRIVRGKLYLNYDAKIQRLWEKDMTGRIAKAEKNWPTLHE
jgi:YHS domain-containing protein